MKLKPIIVIGGPTGVGKSETAIRLARLIGGEIVSADSMQVYQGMDVGTAKVSKEQQAETAHHMLDIVSPLESYSAADYQRDARCEVSEIHARGHLPIVTGGTGFYIQALLNDIDFHMDIGTDEIYRNHLNHLADIYGTEHLHGMLAHVDPQSAQSIHPHNRQRIIRALEYFEHTGTQFSVHNKAQTKKKRLYDTVFFVLTDSRNRLYERINKRAEKMVREGLIEETQTLLSLGCQQDMTSMQALGYRETAAMLQKCGDSVSEEVLLDLMKSVSLHTRHYAKRQLTWFRRETDTIWLSWEDYDTESILDKMTEILKNRKIIL